MSAAGTKKKARPMRERSELPLFALALIAILGIVYLTSVHIVVPNILNEVVLAAIVGGSAVTQTSRKSSDPDDDA